MSSAGGVTAGTATAGAGIPAAILACNVAQVILAILVTTTIQCLLQSSCFIGPGSYRSCHNQFLFKNLINAINIKCNP